VIFKDRIACLFQKYGRVVRIGFIWLGIGFCENGNGAIRSISR
jgi:hypothetical protein